MLEIFVSIAGIVCFFSVLNAFNINDDSLIENKNEDNKDIKKSLYRKFDNMNTSELKKYLRDNNIDEYNCENYGREALINKLVERIYYKNEQ